MNFLVLLIGLGTITSRAGYIEGSNELSYTRNELNQKYKIIYLCSHFSRVFISISVEKSNYPTLLESKNFEKLKITSASIFPYEEAHANGNHSDCSKVQQANWSYADSFSRLWVFDMGWKSENSHCPPKLILYDLIRNNIELLRISFGKYVEDGGSNLLAIKVPKGPSSNYAERFIVFILKNKPVLYFYDIVEQKWYERYLESRKYENVTESFPVYPVDFEISQDKELLISDPNGVLYGSVWSHDPLIHKIRLKLLGQLLGPSRSMISNTPGYLFYTVPKFGVLVFCNYSLHKEISAENNEIIHMTSKNIQQIFFGSDGLSVWIVIDQVLKPVDRCFIQL